MELLALNIQNYIAVYVIKAINCNSQTHVVIIVIIVIIVWINVKQMAFIERSSPVWLPGTSSKLYIYGYMDYSITAV